MGPVQVLVVGFEQPAFSGEVLAEFARLREAGIVRLVDLLLVSRGPDGALETLTAPAEFGSQLGGLAAALLGRPADGADETADETGAETADDQPADGGWSLADAVPAGSAAAVALIEHLWAGPLTAAVRRAGGSALEETWLAPADVAQLESLIAAQGGG
jgi:hypothetical protein